MVIKRREEGIKRGRGGVYREGEEGLKGGRVVKRVGQEGIYI